MNKEPDIIEILHIEDKANLKKKLLRDNPKNHDTNSLFSVYLDHLFA